MDRQRKIAVLLGANGSSVVRLALACVLGWILGGAVTKNALAQTSASAKSLPAEQVFKNIQVFKGMPADQFLPTMQFISGSLGVHCGLCHHQEEAKRDDDGKPQKVLARKMIQMVADINNNTFGGRKVVSCYTCHRGSTHVTRPAAFDPEMSAESATVADKAALAAASPDVLFEKYVAAAGGAETLQKLASFAQKGTVSEVIPGEKPVTSPYEVFSKTGNYRAVTHLKNGDAVATYTGKDGWYLFAGSRLFVSTMRIWDFPVPYEPLRAMRSDELEATQLGNPLTLIARLKDFVQDMRTTGMEKVGGRDTFVVSGRTQNLTSVKVYFDKESGLITRLAYDITTPLGPNPHKIDYTDFRDVSGVKVAFEWKASDIKDGYYHFKMTDMQSNAPVDEAMFAKPAVPAVSK